MCWILLVLNLSEYLKFLGVERVYFSSGYRNASLLESFSQFEIIHGFLDQSLGFQALGYAKASNKPCVVCTTSGSAVAQILPALIEAYFSHIKLILISADRPEYLHLTGAPQSINQKKLMPMYARNFQSSPMESLNFDDHEVEFPIHLNIEIENEKMTIVKRENIEIYKLRKVLIILNQMSDEINKEHLMNLLEKYELNIYQDVESPLYRNVFKNEIFHEAQLDRVIDEFDAVIRIGKVSNSRTWRSLDSRDLNIYHLDSRGFKACVNGEVVEDATRFLENFPFDKVKPIRFGKIDHLQLLAKYPESEASLTYSLLKSIDKENSVVFIGNSMPVRYLKFYRPKYMEVMANRGANGIDGLISTAAGIATYYKEKTVNIILGDLSYFYDEAVLNFHLPTNLHIYVINNSGGRIFERVSESREIVNEHKVSIAKKENVYEVIVKNEQTKLFWNEFNASFQ